jgi:dihydroorotate dehydrogenase (fumarate)
MMDLSTTYLGMRLPHPLIVGAGPLCDDLDGAKALEDAGAAMVVLRSLFQQRELQRLVRRSGKLCP